MTETKEPLWRFDFEGPGPTDWHVYHQGRKLAGIRNINVSAGIDEGSTITLTVLPIRTTLEEAM